MPHSESERLSGGRGQAGPIGHDGAWTCGSLLPAREAATKERAEGSLLAWVRLALLAATQGSPLREARESFEREYLKIQIRRFSGNISRTASFIGMERSALHRKLKALGLGDKRDMDE